MAKFKYNKKFLTQPEQLKRFNAQRLCFNEGWIVDPVTFLITNDNYRESLGGLVKNPWEAYLIISEKYDKMLQLFISKLRTDDVEISRVYDAEPFFKLTSKDKVVFVRVIYNELPEIRIDNLYGCDYLIYGDENEINYKKVPKKINLLSINS